MGKKEKLEKLNQEIRNCKKCSLWKTRKNAVPGEGPVNAKIMCVGMAPGGEEDKVGKPFVGRAGKLLNELLKIARIKREKIFVTSPLKCLPQPPKNRKPTKKEIEACLPYLKKQIEIINPQKFILLGGVAFSVFFPKEKLKDFRGEWIILRDRLAYSPIRANRRIVISGWFLEILQKLKDEKKFFITYHPAAGLRFPKIRICLRRDFTRLRQNLDSLR